MWDRLVHSPRGRISARKFIMSLATLFVACFLFISLISSTAFAATAALWSGSNISYEGNTYTPFTPQSGDGLPPDTIYYKFGPRSGSNVAKFIEFPSSSSPQQVTSANLQNFEVSGSNFSHPSNQQSITITPAGQQTADTNSSGSGTSCAVDGIGWIVCPVSNSIASAMDVVYKIISGFLEVQPLQTTSNGSLYKAWAAVRSLANVAFVIAFILIIYAQITSIGLSNYEIKKMMPKLIVTAIMVNLSYWMCAIAVDVFNVLGWSIQDIFISIRKSIIGVGGYQWTDGSWQNWVGTILAGGTAATGAAVGGAAAVISMGGFSVTGIALLLLPILAGAFISITVALLVLAARQVIITVLIVLSPLAFVAFLLPNTEDWFKKWRKVFISLLIVFPAFSIIFGGSQLAAAFLIHTTTSVTQVILALAIQVAPLAITPLTLKLGGGILNRFAGIVNNPTKGLRDRTRNWSQDRLTAHRARNLARTANGVAAGAINTRGIRRLRPRNFAYNHEVGKQRREDWKEKNEARTKQRIHNRPEFGAIDAYGRDTTAFERDTETRNKENWNRMVQTSPITDPRRAAIRNAAMQEGRAKLYEDRMTNADDRALQTQINTTPNLRNLKIAADVDAAHAQLQSASVAGDAKLEFQNQVAGDRNLRLMKVATYVAEQQATSIENRLNSNAKARWDQLTRTDAHLQQVRLQEVQASDSAKRVEEQWNSFIEDIRSKGSTASGVTAQNAAPANAIKRLQADLDVESKRQESFKIEQESNLATMFKDDAAVRLRAGGGTEKGAARVYAKAKSSIISAYMDNIKNNRSVISDYSINELMRLAVDGQKRTKLPNGSIQWVSATEEEQMAAYQEVLLNKGNNWSVQKLKDKVAEEGMVYDENTNSFYNNDADKNAGVNALTDSEVESRRTKQQIYVDALKQSKLSIASVSGTDKSDMETGLFRTFGQDAIIRDLKQKKIKTDRWVSTDMDELQRMIQILRDDNVRSDLAANNPDSLDAVIETIERSLTDRRISEHIDGRNQDLMRVIQSYAQQARNTNGAPMAQASKQEIENLAATKIPTNYDPNVMYKGDGTEPTGPA